MEEKKENYFKKAFKDMGESAKMQYQVNKASFQAVKAESKAQFEENRGTNTLAKAKADSKKCWEFSKMNKEKRQEKQKEEMEAQIKQANIRKALAEERYEKAKVKRS